MDDIQDSVELGNIVPQFDVLLGDDAYVDCGLRILFEQLLQPLFHNFGFVQLR